MQPVAYRFSVDEYQRMGEAGIFGPEARVELIDGEIVEMSPIGLPHSSVVDRLTAHFAVALAGRAIVRVQGVMVVGDHSMPQPDLLLLAPRDDFYLSAHPRAGDILLAVEVSGSSVAFDLKVKVPLFRRGGIREVWVVDLPAGLVHVHRGAGPDGWESAFTVTVGDQLAPLAFPDLVLDVAHILV